jgi:hypothetical protein
MREVLEQPQGDRGGDQGVSGAGGPDGFGEQGGAGVLEDESDGPGS